MSHEEINALIDKIDTETTRVGQLVRDQATQIKAGMTPAEADAIKTRLFGVADRLDDIGANPDNPIPPV